MAKTQRHRIVDIPANQHADDISERSVLGAPSEAPNTPILSDGVHDRQHRIRKRIVNRSDTGNTEIVGNQNHGQFEIIDDAITAHKTNASNSSNTMRRKKRRMSKEERLRAKYEKNPHAPVTSLLHDYLMLLVKIGLIISVAAIMLTFVFGFYRETTNYMEPAIKDGDLVLYYRLAYSYSNGQLIAFEYDGKELCGRIVAREGDVVDISDEGGLIINGSRQQEYGIYKETTKIADGVTFPITVPEHSVFVLGDNRTEAIDSRIIGCINLDDTLGEVMGIFRRRNL